MGDGRPIDITVVLPVLDEARHLAPLLDDVLGQELGALQVEVLVVDGGSTDGTVQLVDEVATRDDRVRRLANPERRSSSARAIGVDVAHGRFLCFVDGHCRIPNQRMLADMVELFERTGAACLARPQPLRASPGTWVEAISLARSSRFGHSLSSTVYSSAEHPVSPVSAGAMYRREVFDLVGNFDPSFDACEDVELNWRVAQAGLTCWTSPRLAVEYEPRATLPALWRQLARYGRGRARLHRKHPTAFELQNLAPVAVVLTPVMAVIAVTKRGRPRRLLLAPTAVYFVANATASIHLARKRRRRMLARLFVTFPVIHIALGVGYLRGLLESGRPPARSSVNRR
jgi:succinoglycan biosynthesis protein ExoA